MISVNLLRLKHYPIYQQLQLEEALLRADQGNWCILNEGTPPAIVLGISGKPHELLHENEVIKRDIPIIRRFSGGGTVVVDHNTVFTTFIFNTNASNIECCPCKIMKWTHTIFSHSFDFELQENDFVISNRKFGGNAQYLCKQRWLHHSSFLWDFDSELMNCLKMPAKQPNYRALRDHHDFLCTLKEYMPSKQEWLNTIMSAWGQHFNLIENDLESVQKMLDRPHRKATAYLDLKKYR